MLLVKTYLAPSGIHGLGLFAAEPIARGAVVWRFDERVDRRYTKEERAAVVEEPLRSFLGIYAYPSRIGSDVFFLDGDHAKFMNHSDTPNTTYLVDPPDYIATCDIAPGDEMVCDYREFASDVKSRYGIE